MDMVIVFSNFVIVWILCLTVQWTATLSLWFIVNLKVYLAHVLHVTKFPSFDYVARKFKFHNEVFFLVRDLVCIF